MTDTSLPEELAVAIIGMAGCFPGASNISEYWQNLVNGVESITQFDEEELRQRGVDEELLKNDAYVKAGAFVEDIEMFDADFFDMAPREAEITDPQHRILLECAHQALESAGYCPENHPGSTALYAGVGLNTYLLSNLMSNPQILQNMGMHQLLLGNDKCYAASRIAYKLNLKGPCLLIDTACSSSLVSIITGYKSLISYDCDMALAGGAKINSADQGYMYEPGSINSPDGHCRTFDAEANGTVFGSGAGMILMKRMDDAIRDNDNILAVIRGGAINNDGSDKVGFTAPSVRRQKDVIEDALAFSEIPAESISYVEAHGTGTRLGDPVEFDALKSAFSCSSDAECLIGSVKSNIGHLESAAGVAGLIKVVESLRHETIPASLNFSVPNPAIDFANSPFRVAAQNTEWPRRAEPRRACISSFGLGGTNAHLIVEEAPDLNRQPPQPQAELLLLSAKCSAALEDSKANLQNYLAKHSDTPLRDIAFTLASGRAEYNKRSFAIVSETEPDSSLQYQNADAIQQDQLKNAWLIPGQGVQSPGMSAYLYQRFARFRESLDTCSELFQQHLGLDIKKYLLDPEFSNVDPQSITTIWAQPAIFTHAVCVARLLEEFGIRPTALLGHSLGEYVAVHLSGALNLENAVALVAKRASLMNGVEAGHMLSVSATLEQIHKALEDEIKLIDIAAINSKSSIVLSGNFAAVDTIKTSLEKVDVKVQTLHTSHAFHSRMLDSILNRFEEFVASLSFSQISIPIISSMTGSFLSNSELVKAGYWSQHLRSTVQFSKAVETLNAENLDCIFDLGPSSTASSMWQANQSDDDAIDLISCASHASSKLTSDYCLLRALGRYWTLGGRLDWKPLYENTDCHRTTLPGYPFQKQRHWVDPLASQSQRASSEPPEPHQVVKAHASNVNNDFGNSAPRNATEEIIVNIWQDLLGIAPIGISDNFFELGGQSLLASRVMTRIYEQTGIELDVSVLFDAPTVEGIAIELLRQQASSVSEQDIEQLIAEIVD